MILVSLSQLVIKPTDKVITNAILSFIIYFHYVHLTPATHLVGVSLNIQIFWSRKNSTGLDLHYSGYTKTFNHFQDPNISEIPISVVFQS